MQPNAREARHLLPLHAAPQGVAIQVNQMNLPIDGGQLGKIQVVAVARAQDAQPLGAPRAVGLVLPPARSRGSVALNVQGRDRVPIR